MPQSRQVETCEESRGRQGSEGDGRSSVPVSRPDQRAGCKCPRDRRPEDREPEGHLPRSPSGCRRTDRGALPAESARVRRTAGYGPGPSAFSSISRDVNPGAGRTGRAEFRGPTMRAHPFTSRRFHVLLNSLFKVLFNFPSRYLSAIGLVTVFSLRWSLPPTLGCILKQPDSWDARSRRVPRR